MSESYKVRLVSVADETTYVRFNVAPTFSEQRNVEYTPVAPIHMPGSIQVYKNSGSRTFSIGAQLASRTHNEAAENIKNLQRLRGWTLPYFGKSSTLDDKNYQKRQEHKLNPQANVEKLSKMTPDQINEFNKARLSSEGYDLLGAPPMVLYLYAYSTSTNDGRQQTGGININRVPVVITSLGITYPKDVDYITTDDPSSSTPNTEPFPVLMEVTIELVETHSPREYERFNLTDFHLGKLANF